MDQGADGCGVLRLSEFDGSFISKLLARPDANETTGVAFGPDGNLYTAVQLSTNSFILKYDWRNGALIGAFGPNLTQTSLYGLAFGPDGSCYVCVHDTSTSPFITYILRLDGRTGAVLSKIVPDPSLGLADFYDLAFGPDGNLYVSDMQHGIIQFRGSDGAYLGLLATVPLFPQGIAFGPDGNLYLVRLNGLTSGEVLKFNPKTGEQIATFIPSSNLGLPRNIAFGPDHHLYVTDRLPSSVRRFDETTGDPIDTFSAAPELAPPWFLAFSPMRLQLDLTDSTVHLSWPQSIANYQLQSTPTLSPPTWTPVDVAPILSNSYFELNQSLDSSERFFRLIGQ
jgi:DNA-binding beta-propeller fold protein YncE